MSEVKKKKAGQVALELAAKAPDSRDPIELQRELMREYCDEVIKCALHGRSYYTKPYYVVVITKKERLMQNVLRSYYFHRSTCPTPDYDQAVYQFDPVGEAFKEIWVIPDKETCETLYQNALQVVPEEKQLLNYVLDFASGALFQKALQLNGEVLVKVSKEDIN